MSKRSINTNDIHDQNSILEPSSKPESSAPGPNAPSDPLNANSNRSYSERYFELIDKRNHLPVYQHKKKLIEMLDQYNKIVLVGETGSGKTTQIPQWCMEYLNNNRTDKFCVACTQPRR